MSSRNATAADRTPVNAVLHQLEAHMGDHKLRGHVYLTDRTVVVFRNAPDAGCQATGLKRRTGAGQARPRGDTCPQKKSRRAD